MAAAACLVFRVCASREIEESKRLCSGQDSFLPDVMCGWMPDWVDAPAEGSRSAFAYLSIIRAILSMLFGIVSKAGRVRSATAQYF